MFLRVRWLLAALLESLLLGSVFVGKTAAQQPAQFRPALQVTDEGMWAAGLRAPGPRFAHLLVIQPSLACRSAGGRWHFSTTLAGFLLSGRDQGVRLRVRELYAGAAAGDLEFTAGKKILRWGVGYAFTATGVLDPPRVPTDPSDRLNLNEGRELVQADWIRGAHALTAVWASAGLAQRHRDGIRETAALRYNTLLSGFDVGLIVSHDRGRPTAFGANITRVFGSGFEVHAEAARREGASFLLGTKYTRRGGFSLIGEYYSPGAARSYPDMDESAGMPGQLGLPGRRGHYAFLMASKSRLRELPGWKEWDLSASVVSNLVDHSRVVVLDATRRIRNRFALHGRAQLPAGKRWQSEYGMIPFTALISVGFRFNL